MKEVEYYKKRVIFYKNKININLISRKISSENAENNNIKQKNNNITSSIVRPQYNKIKNKDFNQSGKILRLRSDRKILSSIEFPSLSGNKYNNIKNKLLSKTKTRVEKGNDVSEFLTDNNSKDDSSKNLTNMKNKTVIENLDLSNDFTDDINEMNNSENFDLCENLNINKLFSQQLNQENIPNYSKHSKNNSELINTKSFNIK